MKIADRIFFVKLNQIKKIKKCTRFSTFFKCPQNIVMALAGSTIRIFIREIKCTLFLLNSVLFNYEHVPTHNILLLNLYEIKIINKHENTVNHLSDSNKILSVGRCILIKHFRLKLHYSLYKYILSGNIVKNVYGYQWEKSYIPTYFL